MNQIALYFFYEIARFSDNFMRFPKTINKKLDKPSPKKVQEEEYKLVLKWKAL